MPQIADVAPGPRCQRGDAASGGPSTSPTPAMTGAPVIVEVFSTIPTLAATQTARLSTLPCTIAISSPGVNYAHAPSGASPMSNKPRGGLRCAHH
jgi:hypothetical protein